LLLRIPLLPGVLFLRISLLRVLLLRRARHTLRRAGRRLAKKRAEDVRELRGGWRRR
jgi:hypothetical protein